MGLIIGAVGLGLLVIIGIAAIVLGIFFSNIIIFNSIAIGIISGVAVNHYFQVHPAFCLLIGIGVVMLMAFLQGTTVGFWIISVSLTLVYASFVRLIILDLTKNDIIWGWVSFGLAAVLILGLHLYARECLPGAEKAQ